MERPWKTRDTRLVLLPEALLTTTSSSLALEPGTNGSTLESFSSLSEHPERVFNTSMTGYQEILTDPSYAGQFVLMTQPHIGNTGVNTSYLFTYLKPGFAVSQTLEEYRTSWAFGSWMMLLALFTIVFALLLCRLVWVVRSIGTPIARRNQPLKTLIVLGSGGHTAEMLDLVRMLDMKKYSPRCYVAGVTDNMSLPRAQAAEEKEFLSAVSEDVEFCQVYRSREVGQSYLTSIATTLAAMVHSLKIVFRVQPDLILCNGPGTCLPICVTGFLINLLGLKRVILVYVESIARVKKLSLTGLIFYKLHLMDQFFVQWPQLKQQYPRTKFVGRLM